MREAADRRAVRVGGHTHRHRRVVRDHAARRLGRAAARGAVLPHRHRLRPAVPARPPRPARPAVPVPLGHGWRPRPRPPALGPAQQRAGVRPRRRGQPGRRSRRGRPPRSSLGLSWPPKRWPVNGNGTTAHPDAGQRRHHRPHPRRRAGDPAPALPRRARDGRAAARPHRGVTPHAIEPRRLGAARMSRPRLPGAAGSHRKARQRRPM